MWNASRRFGHVVTLTMPSIFQDAELDVQFDRDGYVRVPMLGPSEVAQLREAFEKVGDPQAGFFCSVQGLTTEARRYIYETITVVLQPHLERLLRDYSFCVSSYMSKAAADPNSRLAMHQDWSFASEPEHRAVHFWVPLSDVGIDNGCLAVVPGSHKLSLPRRSYAEQSRFAGVLPLLVERYTVELPMPAGEAVLFDGGLVHGSRPNRLAEVRVAATAISVPTADRVTHCYQPAPDTLEIFEVPAEFFWSYQIGERPRGVPCVATTPYQPQPLCARDVLESPFLRPVERSPAPGLEALV